MKESFKSMKGHALINRAKSSIPRDVGSERNIWNHSTFVLEHSRNRKKKNFLQEFSFE